jgi:hypothetical protein
MSLQIFDDDHAGFAILDFQREIGKDDLIITLKSRLLRAGEFFGKGGQWGSAPHFFRAIRVPGRGPGIYRIGPEIVNQCGLTLDLIEIAVHGSNVTEAVDWPLLLIGSDALPLQEPTPVPPAAPAPPISAPPEMGFPNNPPASTGPGQAQEIAQLEDSGVADGAAAGNAPAKAPEPAPDAQQSPSSCAVSDTNQPSSEASAMPPYRFPGETPPKERQPAPPAQPHFWQERTSPPAVLALLPDQPRKSRVALWCGLTAASVAAITILISASWLLCLPIPGSQCKGGAPLEPTQLGGHIDAAQRLKPAVAPAPDARETAVAGAALTGEAAGQSPRAGQEEARFAAAQATARREAEEQRIAVEAAAQATALREAEDRRIAAEAAVRANEQREAQARAEASAAAQAREEASQPAPAMASLSGLQTNLATPVPDGNYSGRTVKNDSCSSAAESVIVTIRNGKVCWEHGLKTSARWAGSIASDGIVRARSDASPSMAAAGYARNGGAMNIEMTYPDCAEPVRLKLLGMIGAASVCP